MYFDNNYFFYPFTPLSRFLEVRIKLCCHTILDILRQAVMSFMEDPQVYRQINQIQLILPKK